MHRQNQRSFALAVLLVAGALLSTNSVGAAGTGSFREIYKSCDLPRCAQPGEIGNLIEDAAGNLYGYATGGTLDGGGSVFELSPETHAGSSETYWKFRYLYHFCSLNECTDGKGPVGSLIVDTAGNLYGTTGAGGQGNNSGTVFELSPNPGKQFWSEKVLYSFCTDNSACPRGQTPVAGLAYVGQTAGDFYDGASNLYGTAASGGKYHRGVAFELKRNKTVWTESLIYDFCSLGGAQCTDGANPETRLVVGSTGTLFGTTGGGGNKYQNTQAGVAFELTYVSGSTRWSEQVLHAFCTNPNCSDGLVPNELTMDSSGNLFGTAEGGGGPTAYCTYGCGVLFELAPSGSETILYHFCSRKDCRDGYQPSAGVAIDGAGNIFGTIPYGGATKSGVLFELSGTSYSVLHNFCTKPDCSDGGIPMTDVIVNGDGTLLGSALYGPIFEWKPKAP